MLERKSIYIHKFIKATLKTSAQEILGLGNRKAQIWGRETLGLTIELKSEIQISQTFLAAIKDGPTYKL